MIIDWVSSAESGCDAFSQIPRIVSHMGFEEKELKTWFSDAGLQSFSWRWAAERSFVPEEHGGDKQLFFAKAVKPL